MNKIEYDILNALDKKTYVTQRILAEESGYSVGIVNRSVKLLKEHGLLDDQMQLTQAAHKILNENKTKNAIISKRKTQKRRNSHKSKPFKNGRKKFVLRETPHCRINQ